MNKIICAFALCLLSAGTPVAATAQDNPQLRDGFWIGFGFGAGSLTCRTCSDAGGGGSTFAIRLGGTLTQKLLVGAQIDVWARPDHSSRASDGTSFGNVAAAVYYYPVQTSGAYLMGGTGIASWTVANGNSTQTSSSGPALTLGAGYDWRVAKSFALSPNATFILTKLNVEGTQRTMTALNFGLGFTWP